MHFHCFILTGDDKPRLPDLLTCIIEQYAVHWKELGLKLGLKEYQLANISEDNANRKSRQAEVCCREMLKEWLQEISTPTWGKLDDAIKQITDSKGTMY